MSITMAPRDRPSLRTARHERKATVLLGSRGTRRKRVYPCNAIGVYTCAQVPALPQSGVQAVTMISTKAPCAIKLASTVARAGLAVGK